MIGENILQIILGLQDIVKKKQIRYYSENEIYLLKRTQMNGKHLELYSYIFYITNLKNKTFKPFGNSTYYQSTSWDLSTIRLSNWKYENTEYIMDTEYNHKNNTYSIGLYNKNDTEISLNISNILDDINFSIKDKKCILNDILEINLLDKIKDTCDKLKEIQK